MVACAFRCISVLIATVSLLAAAPAGAAPLVGEWRFDEGAGQVAADSSSSGLTARLGIAPGPDGADPAWVPGISGSALRFDGGEAVVVPDSRALEPTRISIEAWVRRQGTPGRYAYIVSKGSNGCVTSSYGLYTGAGRGMAFYVSIGSTSYVVSPAATPEQVWDGAWHHVVGTYDGQMVRLYLDGAEVGGGSPDTRPIVYGLASTDPYIGTYRGGCELGFTGDLDTLRIWGAALTPAEVATLATPPSPRRRRRWRRRRDDAASAGLRPGAQVGAEVRRELRARDAARPPAHHPGRHRAQRRQAAQARARAAERHQDPARAHDGCAREGALRRPPAALREAPEGARARALVPEHERRRPPLICGGRGDPPSSAAMTRSTSPRLAGALVAAGRGVRVAGL